MKVAINGFGRIGRLVLKAARGSNLEFVAINDLTDAKTLAHLLKYDSVHGKFPGEVGHDGGNLVIDGKKIPVLAERNPDNYDWKKYGADVILECTGIFKTKDDAMKHLKAGAKKVLISAPAKNHDGTFIPGINTDLYDKTKHDVISIGSCTTNCLAPVAKVLMDNFGIVKGFMTTIHSYTNDQKILDAPHKDLRRARAAAVSMIPTTTGAAKAIKLVIPDLDGKFDGYALRVPTSTVSVVDFTAEVEKDVTTEELRQLFRDAAATPRMKGILQAVEEPLVSVDYKGDSHSSSVDLQFTSVLGKEKSNFIKVVTWYDNEWGYSVRTADLAALMAKSL